MIVDHHKDNHRLEAELEALSSAYTSIEAHAHSLEAQLAARPEDANGIQKADKGIFLGTSNTFTFLP